MCDLIFVRSYIPDGLWRHQTGGGPKLRARRKVAYSNDGGETFTKMAFHEDLVEPTCQASIRRAPTESGLPIVYSGPNSETSRENMTLKYSVDSGQTFQVGQVLHVRSQAIRISVRSYLF